MIKPRDPYRFCPECGNRMIQNTQKYTSKCTSCKFTDWNNPVPVVACLVIHENHAILARNSKWPPGMFSVISGFLEYQEDPEKCAIRETFEELNLVTKSIQWIDSMVFPELNQIILGYSVHTEGSIKPNSEIAEIKRIPMYKLKGWDFGTGYLVQKFLEKQKSSNQ